MGSHNLTQERLKTKLHYDPFTGVFSRVETGVKKNVGTAHTKGYLQIRVDYKRYLSHRLAWFYVYGEWPSELDHINGDKTDNRISNLRAATRSLNNANTKCRSQIGLKGVVKTKHGYRAAITINKRFHYLGLFETPEAAHAAYCAAANAAFGAFHRAA